MSDVLQQMIAATPVGGHLDLGAKSYAIGVDPTQEYPVVARHPITISGAGATLLVGRSKLLHRPAVTARGPGVQLLGDVTVMHAEDPKNAHYEQQNGIETQGADQFICDWKVEHAQGSSYYLGKDITKPPGTGWTTNAHLFPSSTNAGRQHVALQAVKRFEVRSFSFDTCGAGHSVIVFEPNGHDWGCQDGVISGGTVRGPMDWLFGSLGLGDHQPNSGNLARIMMRDVSVFGHAAGIEIMHGVGNRRGPFWADNISSDTVANQATIRLVGVDGFHLTRYRQPASRGVNLLNVSPDCTDVVTSFA